MIIERDDLVYDSEREPLDNIARALFACANALERIGTHVKYLGVGDAASTMGAVEYLATQVKEAGQEVRDAVLEHAEAVRERGGEG